MSGRRQLNIRDDEIYELAHEIAKRRGVTAKEAVRLALKAYGPPAPKDDRDRAQRKAELDDLIARMAPLMEPGTNESDDAWLYDEDGLPR